MANSDLVADVTDLVDVDRAAFDECVDRETARLKEAVREGTFDNSQAIVGLEYEFYGLDERTCTLTRVPRRLLELLGVEPELGLHNAEMGTNPQPLNAYGMVAQGAEIRARLDEGQVTAGMEGIRLVSDALWTVPPEGETAAEYLSASVVDDGVKIATNMSERARYHAMSNTHYDPTNRIETPHVDFEIDTVMLASLTTSIQPHYQVRHAPYLPEYFGYALRVAGPLLALGVNSPFFPADLYDDAPAERIIEDAWMENRVAVFEQSLNPVDAPEKVTFPHDFATVEEAIDRVAVDEPAVPEPVEPSGRFDDRFRHFRHKHGTYWRWVRPVFEGATRSAANARIEFRPIPGQPTVRDSIGFLAAFAGLMESLHRTHHPVAELEWEQARDNFYAAMRDGLDADLVWIDADGTRTTDTDAIYEELFAHARAGLETRGIDALDAEAYLGPLRERIERGVTPARWKHANVRDRVADGADLETAIFDVQRQYVHNQADTLLEGQFVSWIDGESRSA